MSDANGETPPKPAEFDFSAFPADTLFYDRRSGLERRQSAPEPAPEPARPDAAAGPQRRAKKERRRRVDPTTFEKQYSEDEMEFMKAMQDFKNRSGKSFPSYGEVLRVAAHLGYRKPFDEPEEAVAIGPGELEPASFA